LADQDDEKAKREINSDDVKRFFEDRSRRFDQGKPLVSVLYQDNHPDLAVERDRFEKETLLPLLQLTPQDHVLDLGCGIGRWAEAIGPSVKSYFGVDIDEGMIAIARNRFKDQPTLRFEALRAQDIDLPFKNAYEPFTLVVIVGVLMYLNDAECQSMLQKLSGLSEARILVREPLGIENRLTLDQVWSEELQHLYSAVYRTEKEMRSLLESAFAPAGLNIQRAAPLYPESLNNRKETKQHYFLLA
jgi:SAM-dependent methyltransferase